LGLDEGLAETIAWYRTHRGWWERLRWGRPRARHKSSTPAATC